MKNPLRYKLAKELVPLSGVVELVLGTYVGFQFGAEEYFRACLLTGILAIIAYSSTRLWVWLMEKMTGGE